MPKKQHYENSPSISLYYTFFNDGKNITRKLEETFPLNLWESLSHYTIQAYLENVDKEDILLHLTGGHLVISVKRNDSDISLVRSIYLSNIKENEAKAQFCNSILTINIQKREIAQNCVEIAVE